VWSYALSLSVDPEVRRLVIEWQPTSPLTVAGIAFFGSVMAAAVLVARRPRAVRWPWLLWLVVLASFGVVAERGIVWWAVGAPPIVGAVLLAWLGRASAVDRAPGTSPDAPAAAVRAHDAAPRVASAGVEARGRSLANGVLVLALLAAIVLLLPTWRGGDTLYGPPGLLVDAPRGITDALLARTGPSDRVFNAQRWGSWFELAVPTVPVFVDSRIELFPPEVWADQQAIGAGEPGWQASLDRWGVTVLAISREQQAGLLDALASDPAWREVLSDEDGAVYVRAEPAP